MAINKVIYGGNTLIDLTGDTITTSDLLYGVTAHDKSGASITGSCTYDSDTSGDTAVVAEILSGKTAHARGTALEGTMTNNGAVTGTISTKAGQYTVPQGYHDGSGKVSIDSTEQGKITSGNIKSGITILGVTGSYAGEPVSVQANKNVAPGTSSKTVTPDDNYDYLAQVTVSAISYVETDNSAGGKTATIAG